MDLLKKLTNFKLKILLKLKLFISMKMSIINLYFNIKVKLVKLTGLIFSQKLNLELTL